jgi:hypothetical protein
MLVAFAAEHSTTFIHASQLLERDISNIFFTLGAVARAWRETS